MGSNQVKIKSDQDKTNKHWDSMAEDPTNPEGPSTFHRFSDLPTELKDEIWDIHKNDQKYTRNELVAIFTDFYTFMTTKLLPSNAMRIPPPGGWPNISQESCRESDKTDFAIDVLRHLPYLEESEHEANTHNIHYKCELIDYSSRTAVELVDIRDHGELYYADTIQTSEDSGWEHILMIASGYESGGRNMYLDTKTGEMIVDEIRCGHDITCDVKEYFDWLKEQYVSLKMIKLPSEDTIESHHGNDSLGEVSESTVFAQPEGWDLTDLDQEWIQQIYKLHGWPGDDFRKEECMQAIRVFIQRREGGYIAERRT